MSSIQQDLEQFYLRHYPQEVAKTLEKGKVDEMRPLVSDTPMPILIPILAELPADHIRECIGHLAFDQIGTLLNALPIEKSAKIYAAYPDHIRRQIIEHLSIPVAKEITAMIQYPPETAGALMDKKIITFKPTMTAREAIDLIKARKKKGIRVLFTVDDDENLAGMVSMQDLIMADEKVILSALSKKVPLFVTDLTPQEDIVEILEKSRMTDLPVVNIQQQFVGIIRYHTLMQATREELTKDMLMMVGASIDERALSKVWFAVRKRLPWLAINLLTAFLAASVVGLFEGTIAQFTALAVLLPVVAGQSGNTGAQALAVTMRGLALREVRLSHAGRILFKELRVSLITGVVIGATTAIGVYFWSHSYGLMAIIGISMVLSMLIASISGAAVPLVLARLGQDPASSSSIILTTITDVAGFFSFLGIAVLLSRFI